MIFVLQDWATKRFYAGTVEDKFGIQAPHLVDDLNDALVFRAQLRGGKVVAEPTPPEEDLYEMKSVKFEL